MTSQPGEPPAAFRHEYEGDLVTLRSARRHVVSWLELQGVDDDTKQRAALIVSELTSNAVQASPGVPYTVEATRLDDEFATITVRNHPGGQVPPPREKWRPAAEMSLKELSPRGRGLLIVESLSDGLTIEHHLEEVAITARLRIDGAGTAIGRSSVSGQGA
jgi:anti-sigma regulatory factor (Ser/Thr protein kinase)